MKAAQVQKYKIQSILYKIQNENTRNKIKILKSDKRKLEK